MIHTLRVKTCQRDRNELSFQQVNFLICKNDLEKCLFHSWMHIVVSKKVVWEVKRLYSCTRCRFYVCFSCILKENRIKAVEYDYFRWCKEPVQKGFHIRYCKSNNQRNHRQIYDTNIRRCLIKVRINILKIIVQDVEVEVLT